MNILEKIQEYEDKLNEKIAEEEYYQEMLLKAITEQNEILGVLNELKNSPELEEYIIYEEV